MEAPGFEERGKPESSVFVTSKALDSSFRWDDDQAI